MFKWSRPIDVPYPSVWLEFKAKDRDSDELVNYRVQDLPEDRFEDAIKHMLENFARDENTCRCKELTKYADAIQEVIDLWRIIVQQKLAIACFKEGSDEFVGCNFLVIVTEADKDALPKPKSFPWNEIWKSVMIVAESENVYKKYNVDKYMSALGLSVSPHYRGRGIATEILKARVPLCKAIGVPLTSTVFTNLGSQIPAARAGFVEDSEITYDEIETKHGVIYPGNTMKSMKLMSLKIE